ncbi:MAG TPA: FUSC family protein [Trebonia sp.]|nr:FUSC family protein [Trebonia sp.]
MATPPGRYRPAQWFRPARWRPAWSVPAALRAVRATLVIPALFTIATRVVGNEQMALFAFFGGFATLVVAGFGGSRRDKLSAHAQLAVVGSISIVIGTLVSGTPWLAAIVTIPVAFTIFFAGVLGPAPASGTTAALFLYVLPVASMGGMDTIGSRLEGWWVVSVAGTLAVLLLSPRNPGDRIRAAASALASEIAGCLRAAANGQVADMPTLTAARDQMRAVFIAAPFRPIGLATSDQALASVVQMLEQGATEVADAFDGHIDMTQAIDEERQLLIVAASVLDKVTLLLAGARDAPGSPAFLEELEHARATALRRLRELSGSSERAERMAAAHAAHAQAVAVAARSTADSALIVAGRADPATITAARSRWYGLGTSSGAPGHDLTVRRYASALLARMDPSSRLSGVAGATGVVVKHASVRSVWFANSLRGAVALAIAVAVADASGVGHAFWVVLGTVSVLRTSAAGTGGTALRALGGAAIGFVVGALLLIGIGTGETALWVAFPIAVLIASYAPGTAPFAIGQAAFTVIVVVVFNILVPIGWKLGLLRVEDVALGCAVSLVVGVIFWPRGASALVGDGIADAFQSGATYLTQAVGWALNERPAPPDAASAALTAGLRLDDGLRVFLAEQGTKRASKEDLWALVTQTQRLRLTAHTLAGLRDLRDPDGDTPPQPRQPPDGSGSAAGTPACERLRRAAADLAGFYGRIADEVGHSRREEPELLCPPKPVDAAVPRQARPGPAEAPSGSASSGSASPASSQLPHPNLLWVQEHLHHLARNAPAISEPALHLAQARRLPWWR